MNECKPLGLTPRPLIPSLIALMLQPCLYGQEYVARHVIHHLSNPRLLGPMASYNMAINFCEAFAVFQGTSTAVNVYRI